MARVPRMAPARPAAMPTPTFHAALDSTPREMVREYGQRQASPIPPVWVDGGPVHDVVLIGADAQLSVLPILTHNELDAGPFVAGGCMVAKDPDSGEINVGLYRHQVLGPQRLGVFFNPGHHGDYLRQRYEELAKDRFIVGSPDEVAEEMLRYNRLLGVNHIIMSVQGTGLPQSQVLETFELMAKEVFPKVQQGM